MDTNENWLTLSAVVADTMIDGVEVILGMNVIVALKEVTVTRNTI